MEIFFAAVTAGVVELLLAGYSVLGTVIVLLYRNHVVGQITDLRREIDFRDDQLTRCQDQLTRKDKRILQLEAELLEQVDE